MTKHARPAPREKMTREMDELLEKVWTQREKGDSTRTGLLTVAPHKENAHVLKRLEEAGLITLGPMEVTMTPGGEVEAEQILRRHRLTERLFADVFETREEVWEKDACELEHKTVLSDEAVMAICSFLGHPPTCPHGRPIPRGVCCSKFKKEITPFVIPLPEAPIGESCRIVFMTPKTHMRMERLAVMGILPGSLIRIHQKRPSYVIRAGETDIALDPDIAKNIFVKKV